MSGNQLDTIVQLLQAQSGSTEAFESVAVYADLPLAEEHDGTLYLVRKSTGVPLINYKSSGWYRSDGAVWNKLADYDPTATNSALTDIKEQLDGTLSVSVENLPVTQPVSGTVAVSNLPATQPVSGSVSVSNFPAAPASQAVTGTFFQATQPVSAAALPLPSGASTEATLALIKAKTDNLDVALSTRTKPADSQTVTGSVSVSNLPATQPVSGSVSVSNLPATQAVTLAVAPTTPVTGAFYPATQPVSNAGTFPVQATQNGVWTYRSEVGSSATAAWTSATIVDTAISVSCLGFGTILVTVRPTGSITNGRINFEVSDNDGVSWYAVNVTRTINGGGISSAYFDLAGEASYIMHGNISGLTNFRARLGTVIAGAGTQNVLIRAFGDPADSAIVVNQSNANSMRVQLSDGSNNSVLTGTGALKVDGAVTGTFFQATQPVSGPATDAQLRASPLPVSGTVTANIGTGNLAGITAVVATSAPTLTKGSQGANGFMVQEIKDSGRTHMNFSAIGAASGSTGVETIITLTKSSGTAATANASTFVVTNGKTFRITSITFATRGHLTATAQVTTFNLRINTAGAVIASSTPVTLSARCATPATALAWDRFTVPLGDGYEIVGNGTIQFGVSANAVFVTNAPTWDVLLTGYEY